MNYLASLNRSPLLSKLKEEAFDLLIIGGGITGAGIALDAASRGLKVALVEKYDFSSGTSSRSTKLIHGGLRYLKQFEIQLVREVGRERAIVHKLAPHLVVAEKMLLPIIEGGTFGKMLTSLGLMVYDVLAGVESEDQRVMLSRKKTLKEEPLLDEENLLGGGLYAEYRTDDARLTMEVIKTASSFGALSINYVEATDFLYKDEKVCGLTCQDRLSGESLDIFSKYVISAAGPWVDRLREKNGSLSGKRLHLTKGVHIVVPHAKLPVRHSVYFDVPDGRMIFAIPRNKVTYIGTTDTEYKGDLNQVAAAMEDVTYLLEAVNHAFPSIHLEVEDVESSWAGLRPLIHEDGKSASELSRKDEIFISPNGLLSIAGGKLTGYRKMSERIVDMIAKHIRREHKVRLKSCHTEKLVLEGGDFKNQEAVIAFKKEVEETLSDYGLGYSEAMYLVSNYGRQCTSILKLLAAQPAQDVQLDLLVAEFTFGVEQEMVHSLKDFFIRRTGRLYFDIDSVKRYREAMLEVFAEYFSWDKERISLEREGLMVALSEASSF